MELRHVRYFLAVAEELNFTRAAARVGIGQPPLSQQIKDLEAEVGAPLFHRTPQGAELTEAGRAFLENVKVMPLQAERAIQAAQRAARGETGSLKVGFTSSAPFNPVVTSAIRSFRKAYPDLDLRLEEANTTPLVSGLKDGQLDIIFLRSEEMEKSDFQLRHVSKEPLLVALPSSRPAAKSPEIDLYQLRNEVLILTPRDIGPTHFDTVISACRQAGFEPRLGQSALQIGTVINLVAADLGFSLVPASMSQLQVAGVLYRAIKGKAPIARLALAFRRGETSKIVRNFIAQVTA